jgi:hypothetical protein
MRHPLPAAALGLALALAPAARAAEPGGLDGTWVEVEYRPPRAEHPADLPPPSPMTLVIDGHLLVVKKTGRGGRQSLVLPVPGRPGDAHRAIDLMTAVDGATPLNGEFWLTRAIYKIEGGVLTLSESGRDGPRPTSFDRQKPGLGSGSDEPARQVTVFKRQAADPPKGSR